MKFRVIPNEQTPKVEIVEDVVILENRKLLEKFIAFARRQFHCTGLAANQVSCDGVRIMLPFFAILYNLHWDIIIDPLIISYEGKAEEKIEGCLTWLGKKIVAERYPIIDVEYLDIKGDKHTRTITGFEAQIWQHEYDHLLGVEERFV